MTTATILEKEHNNESTAVKKFKRVKKCVHLLTMTLPCNQLSLTNPFAIVIVVGHHHISKVKPASAVAQLRDIGVTIYIVFGHTSQRRLLLYE